VKLKNSSDRPLKISPDLALPRNAATATIVAYGGKGTGKTNFASVLVEEFDRAGIRFAVIDPMGVWWGLRHHADGKQAGIDVLILGGIHGHLPITPESGELVADLVVDEYNTNVVIDISRRADGSMWSIGERIRFVTAFTKRLYQRQGEKRRPLNLVIDEAARFAPQIIRAGEMEVAKCMGAIAVLVEEGRNVGIGVVLITQRSARLNKDVAELADCMISFRIIGPNSMRAVLDWLGEHVDKSRLKEIGEKLRSLPIGSALVISPGWLEFEGVVAMRKRQTFDSSKTPEDGKEAKSPRSSAKPDLDKYRARMAEIVKEVEANDPKELKKRIVKLDHENRTLAAQLANARTAEQAGRGTAAKVKTVEKIVISPKQLTRVEGLLKRGETLVQRWDDRSADAHESYEAVRGQTDALFQGLTPILDGIQKTIAAYQQPPLAVQPSSAANSGHGAKPAARPTSAATSRMLNGHAKPAARPSSADGVTRSNGKPAPRPTGGDQETGHSRHDHNEITPAKQRIIDAVHVLTELHGKHPTKTQVALVAKQSPTSGNYTNYLGSLRSAGLIDYPIPGHVALTADGVDAVSDGTDVPRTSEEIHRFVRTLVGEARWKIMASLIEAYPESLDKVTLAERSGMSATSGNYTNYLGRLRSNGLLDYPAAGHVRAQDILFIGQ